METKRSTFATSFYIKRSAVRNRDGKAPIMVKISVDGDDKAVGTKLFVTPDLWENGKAKGKSTEANEINGQLKEVSARLTNHYHRILREEDFVTAEKLRNAFLGVGVMENCILKDFGNMNREFEAMVEKGQRAKSTYNKYLAVYNHFKTFLWEKKKRTDMAYKELTQGDHRRLRQVPAGGERIERQHPLDIHHAPAQPDRQGVAAGHRPHRPLRRVQP